MNFLLVAVNASFSHTNLAVRTICEFARQELMKINNCEDSVSFCEFTINQPVGEILRGIAEFQPDVVMFSTYIWNGEIIAKIIPDIKKILPSVKIGCGGPEFGFAAQLYLKKLSALDFIVHGEGEQTVFELIKNHLSFEEVKGLFYRKTDQKGQALEPAVFTGERELLCDLSQIPFPYPKITEPDHKIYYYESSRGCPFSCSYCMSSLDKRVRFMPLERVYTDLQIFLDSNVKLVKFVDRTYNLDPDRYIGIWQYILDHHNGKTMFHFEVEAEFLTEPALEFLQKVPEGVMQFEIGVQSSNKETLKAINRSTNTEKLAQNIRRIPRTIHQHLDLIAGLPYENLESFGKSFDFVAALKPDALQLGFLKVLHGTEMESYALKNGWKWMENPVYETFSTPYMSYKDMMFLKDLEILLDAYWNSGNFKSVTSFFLRNGRSVWQFFCSLVNFAYQKNTFAAARRESYWYELMHQWIMEKSGENQAVLYDLLRYDFVSKSKTGVFPGWYKHNYDKNRHLEMMIEAEHDGKGLNKKEMDKKGYAVTFNRSEYEIFDFNVSSEAPENNPAKTEKLIIYKQL